MQRNNPFVLNQTETYESDANFLPVRRKREGVSQQPSSSSSSNGDGQSQSRLNQAPEISVKLKVSPKEDVVLLLSNIYVNIRFLCSAILIWRRNSAGWSV